MNAGEQAAEGKVLYQGKRVLGLVVYTAVGFSFILRVTWGLAWVLVPQALTSLDQGNMLEGVLALGFLAMVGYISFLVGWETWVGVRLIRRVMASGDEVVVERVFGRWRGLGCELRLRRLRTPRWFGLPYYRLETGGGRWVGDIVVNWPENREGVERLKAWLAAAGGGYQED